MLATSDLAEDIAALRRARAALRDRAPERALHALRQRNIRSFTDVLIEERALLEITALCELGRVREARSKAGMFLHEFPTSPLAANVRRSCARELGRR